MNKIRFFVPAVLLFITGVGIIGYACNRVLPDMLRKEAAKLPPLVLHDTMNVTDTVYTRPDGVLMVSLFFSPGSAMLTPEQQQRLLDALSIVPFPEKRMVMLAGYSKRTASSSSGDITLASKRSAAVGAFLIQNGIVKDNIYFRPHSVFSDPLKNPDSTRRVDVSLSEVIH
jgi:outer membrane protein OmpA-like peptidoglycan-associated protein